MPLPKATIEWPLPAPPRMSFLATLPEDTSAPISGRPFPGGVEFTPANLTGGESLGIECIGNTAEKTPTDIPGGVDAVPFAVLFNEKCSSFGFNALPRVQRVAAGLAAVQSHQVAEEFWSGTITGTDQQALVNVASDVLTAGGVASEVALGLLEQAYLDRVKGQRGAVHVTFQTLTALVAASAVHLEGSVWLTASGNYVVADSGYTGAGPGAQAGVWMYATTIPRYRLSEPMILGSEGGTYSADALDRDINDLTLYAERLALVEFDQQAHFAAQTNLTAPAVGGVS